MAQYAEAYQRLSPSARVSPSAEMTSAKEALSSFVAGGAAPLSIMTVQQRRSFGQALLDDLTAFKKLESTDEDLRLLILQALKELSRLPGGSNVQSEPTGMRTLLDQVTLLSLPTAHHNKSSEAASPSSVIGGAFSRAWMWTTATNKTLKPEKKDKAPPRKGSTQSLSGTTLSSTSSRSSDTDSAIQEDRPSPPAASWEATDTALRCLNNAIYLHETSRRTFAEDDLGGGRKAVRLLKNPGQSPADVIFLACRLLFFCTLYEANFNRVAVEEEDLVEHLQQALQLLTSAYKANQTNCSPSTSCPSGSPAQIKAALAEVLKVVFNLGIYYPRVTSDSSAAGSSSKGKAKCTSDGAVLGEGWHDRLLGLLDPVLELLLALPNDSLTSPATNAIGVLLNFPVKPYRSKWVQASAVPSLSPKKRPSRPSTANTARRMANAIFPGSGSKSHPSSPNSSPPKGSLSLVTVKDGSTFTLVNSPEPSPTESTSPSQGTDSPLSVVSTPVLAHLLHLLSSFLSRYFLPRTGAAAPQGDDLDPDHSSTSDLARKDGIDLEDTAQPLLLLLSKLCRDDAAFKDETKALLLPLDIDRTLPLDKRPDFTGRLIRLMGSAVYPRLARASGELLLAICDDDPKTMVGQIGYGPCAGFLVNSGFGYGMPTGKEDGTNDEDDDVEATLGTSIDPITGQSTTSPLRPQDDPLASMTEEEKEAEAEKLFGLFDRLNKTGIMKVPHPVRDLDPERAREMEEEDEKIRELKEEEEERLGLKEFAAYKAGRMGSRF